MITRCHTKRPPTIEGLPALHHYQVDHVPRLRLVVGRQQKRVQAEEHTVVHHSMITIHAGHTHLERADRLEKGSGMNKMIPSLNSIR